MILLTKHHSELKKKKKPVRKEYVLDDRIDIKFINEPI